MNFVKDYNKIHLKLIIKKVEIKEENEQDDDFDIQMQINFIKYTI